MDKRELMSLVLDGEATPQQGRELEHLLATDPQAAAEFAALRVLFGQLERVPQLDPPAGLAGPAMQRFQNFPRISAAKGRTMDPKARKSTLWIGIGAAAAAAIVAGVLLVQWPPDAKNAQGTIVPAQRYRAEQIKAEDVKLGDQAVTQFMQTEAFERMVKDPQVRAMALDPDFQALAKNGQLNGLLMNAASAVAQAKSMVASHNADAVNRAAAKSSAAASQIAASQGAANQGAANVAVAGIAASNAAASRSVDAMSAQAASVLAKYPDAFVRFAQADYSALAKAQTFAAALARYSADAANADAAAKGINANAR
jgi:hypothetical protein